MPFIRHLLLSIISFFLALSPVSTFIEGSQTPPKSFLPSQAQSSHEKAVSTLLFRGLFKYDIYGTLNPDLADTWTISEDGIVYTIKLKDNQYWSDGKKITADDLLYTSYKVADLAGVATDKVDDLTVRFTLPNKYAPFLTLLTVGVMYAESEEKQNPLKPISSSDWRVARVERTGKQVRGATLYTSNTDYEIRKLRFKYYSSEDELETAAKLGEIDGFLSNEARDIPNFQDYKFPAQGIYYALYFNLKNEKLTDVAFRQKLRKTIPVKDLIYDRGISVEGPISRSEFTDQNLTYEFYDEKFKEDIEDVTLTITVPNIPSHVNLAEKVALAWKDKLGLDIDLNVISPADIVSQAVEPRNFEILLYGQEIGRDPDRYVNWHSTQIVPPGLNLSQFEQVRADHALEEGRNELDNDKRRIHYNELQKTVNENAPAIFLYHPFTHYYVSKYFQGIGEKYTFTHADRFLDLINWHEVATN